MHVEITFTVFCVPQANMYVRVCSPETFKIVNLHNLCVSKLYPTNVVVTTF